MKKSLAVVSLAVLLGGCGSVEKRSEFAAPNQILRSEIQRRIDQIPYQHRDELLGNLLWLSGVGEPALDQLTEALRHRDPKVRSSATWCLGRAGDRRTIPHLQSAFEREGDEVARMEMARSLLVLGDFSRTDALIAGLESDRQHVRFLCFEALREQTGQDFGYDHRTEDPEQRRAAVQRWRRWWSEQSTDGMLRTGRVERATPAGSPGAAPSPGAPQDPWKDLEPSTGQGR